MDGAGDTDSHPFVSKKIPVIDFHSLTSETYHYLHTAKDTLDAVKIDDYEKTYRTLGLYVALLDAQLEEILARKIKLDK